MRYRMLFTGALSVAALTLFTVRADAERPGRAARAGQRTCMFQQGPVEPLSAEEEQDVLYMREEEKLARDVYLAMFDLWGTAAFQQISESEQRHMDALGRAVDRYNLEDPVVDDTPGAFTNPVLLALYDQLVDSGGVSALEALMVGAMIEELDIVDIRNAVERTDHADLLRVYDNLMRGSRNHLRTFASLITAAGATYEAQYLTQEEFDAIANSPYEPGGGGNGNAKRVRASGDNAAATGFHQRARARRGR